MDRNRQQKLTEKRHILQQELQLKKIRSRISTQLDYLNEHNFRHAIYYENENLDWITKNLPFKTKDNYTGSHDYQLDIKTNPNTHKIVCNKSEASFQDVLSDQITSILPKDSPLILCCNGGDPELEISIKAFLSKPFLFLSKPEVWVLSKNRNWIFEYIWEQKILRIVDIQKLTPILKVEISIDE